MKISIKKGDEVLVVIEDWGESWFVVDEVNERYISVDNNDCIDLGSDCFFTLSDILGWKRQYTE